MEINASDDRSGTALHTRITDACQMQAVMGSKQPNCVIIDEIDGAIGRLWPCVTSISSLLSCLQCKKLKETSMKGRCDFCSPARYESDLQRAKYHGPWIT